MKKIAVASGFVFAAALATVGVAQRAGHTVTIDEPQSSDQYLAASIVRVVAPVEGDVVAAGRLLIVDAAIAGDVIAAGESVEIRNTVGDDLRAAGRTVAVSGRVDGHVVAAGEQVRLESDGSVGDWAWIAGRNVVIAGRIGGELRAAGQDVAVSGNIGGDAILVGETIRVESGAMIGGDLIVQSDNEAEIAAGATVAGEIIRQDLPDGFGRMQGFGIGVGSTLFLGIALAIAVTAVLLLFPLFSESTARRVRALPLRTLAAGLAIAILTPLLFVILFVTGIGAIAGFGVLGTYLLLLFFAMLFGIAALAQLGLELGLRGRSAGRAVQILAMLLASVSLLFLAQIPLLGPILLLLVCISGLGAVTSELWQRLRSPQAA
jgi:cytoskeletal protein CcmA (bactofilin family)